MTMIMRLMVLAMVCGVMTSAGFAQSNNLVIKTFDSNGQLTFSGLTNAESYGVEWASSPGGPWTNFAVASVGLDAIPRPADGTGIVAVLVPMCYRVVMTTSPAGMVLIPAGVNSGADPDFGAYSLTNTTVFSMDKYPVTKASWAEVYNWAITNGYSFTNAGSGKATNHPVQTVNWYDCVKWCNARSEKEGRTVSYRVGGSVYRTGQDDAVTCDLNVAGYRLPTDVEYAYASRGGVSGQRFPWGGIDTIQHVRANYYSSSSFSYDTSPSREFHPTYASGGWPYTSPVGSFAANGYGLYDMAGNVWEWCWEWCPGYVGVARINRGGGWRSNANECGAGYRYFRNPSYAYVDIGFRAILPPRSANVVHE